MVSVCSDPVLSVRDLRIKIGQQQVVDGLSFDVMPGERICLLGASGSGKSFTAKAVLGLLPPSAQVQGSIRIQGQEAIATPATQRPKNARVSMVFQDSLSALNPLVSIGSQLREPFIRHHGLSHPAATDAAVALLGSLDLPDPKQLIKRTPAELSGGQRQRVCIALAMACKTSLIMAGMGRDPFSSAFMRLESPSFALPLGADGTGRDILARVAHGALSTMGMATVVVFFSLIIGLLIGLAPKLATGPIEITKATPPTIAGLIVAGLIGPSASGAIIAVTAVAWAPLAAHTAALVAEVKAQPHVRITPMLGVGHCRLMSRYILPAVVGPVFRHAMLRLPGVALALAALGFLGLGPRPPSPEWGLILAEGMPYVERAPWAVLIPALALILLSVLAVSLSNLVGLRKLAR